ncbi:MAG: FecCD family ABC transporter permease [Waddliaceae bacterium]
MKLFRKDFPFYLAFGLLLMASALVMLTTGATPLSQVWRGVLERLFEYSSNWNPLLDERLPRLIVLMCTGASLAVSGAILQSLFHNPLASPSVLGISCGGCLVVTLVFIREWHFYYPYAVPLAAFVGCLMTLLLVYALSYRKGGVQITTLILTGIAISSLLLAIQGAISYALRDRWEIIQTITEWEAGSTTDRSWKHVHMQLPLTLVGLMGSWIYCKEINILALGEEEAKNLGVEVSKVRWRLFLCVSLLTGGAIAAMGIIAFFGLVLPHLIRKITGPDNQRLIPLAILAGSATLLTLDVLLRVFGIRSFSIGNISAILGGIFFLLLLFGIRRESAFMRA